MITADELAEAYDDVQIGADVAALKKTKLWERISKAHSEGVTALAATDPADIDALQDIAYQVQAARMLIDNIENFEQVAVAAADVIAEEQNK